MIQVQNLAVRVGSFRLEGISFEIPEGAYAVLMGKTGAGKTTLQECLCGLRPIESGSIRLSGRDVTRWAPARRGVGYVPQDAALFPTMSIRDHLSFAPEIRGWPRQEIDARVGELAELLSIEHLLSRRPAGLSGGEAQRVALGRALAFRPAILLLDEPLSSLDDETRQQMYALLKKVSQHTHVTTLHITHNREDARQLADCHLLLERGRIRTLEQLGQPTPCEAADR